VQVQRALAAAHGDERAALEVSSTAQSLSVMLLLSLQHSQTGFFRSCSRMMHLLSRLLIEFHPLKQPRSRCHPFLSRCSAQSKS
jgi:hypothetical protein